MKRRSFTYVFITMLLLLATVFSAFNAFISHNDVCEHETICEYCEEIAEVENAIHTAMEEHEDCAQINCETCVALTQQIERIEEKKTAEHSCHEIICETCLRGAINRHLRTAFYTLIAFAFVYALLRTIIFITAEKTLLQRAFTLSCLKVRLNN